MKGFDITLAVLMAVFGGARWGWSAVIQTAVNPANGHTYYLLSPSSWTAAEAEAIALGGHLVTINDADEDRWVWETFNSGTGWEIERLLWIGLNDEAEEGVFVWSSGEPVTYTNWAPAQPSGTGGDLLEHWVQQGYIGHDPEYAWNDLWLTAEWTHPLHGVVEIPEPSSLAMLGGFGVAIAVVGAVRRRRRRGTQAVGG